MSENKTGGLDQYGAKPFEQQQFGTAGVEGVKDRPIPSQLLFVVLCLSNVIVQCQ